MRYKEYFIKQGFDITLLKETDVSLYKYFEWEGMISPNIKDSTGDDLDTGYFLMLNNSNTDNYQIHNVLKVEVDGDIKDLSTNIKLVEDDKKYVPSPNTMLIKSKNGIFPGNKIQRGFRGERFENRHDSFISSIFYKKNKDTNKTVQVSSLYIGFSITPTNLKYIGSNSKSVKFSKLYYISKNASTTPCDSFGKQLIDPEFIPDEAYGFNNIFNSSDPANLYTSVVPIKSDTLSRALIQLNNPYISTFRSSEIFTFSFYLSNNFKGKLLCNADVLKIRTDKEIIDSDSILLDTNQYDKYDFIDIESGSKKYTRVVLICKGSSLQNDFYFTFTEGTSGGMIYNPVLYKSKLINSSSSSADCADLRGQGMKLTFFEDISEFNNKQLGGYKLHADYVPEPFYEIID